MLDCGRKTLANSGGGSFLSKAANVDPAFVAIARHIALCLAAHAACPGCDLETVPFSFVRQNCS